MVYEDTETSKFVQDQDGDSAEKNGKAQSGALFRRVMDEDNPKKMSHEEIEITSPALRRLFLKTCLTRAPPGDDNNVEKTSISVKSPFVDFIWFWDSLDVACHASENDTHEEARAREDLKQVMGLIRKSTVEPYFKVRDTFLAKSTSPAMPYEYLWTIFPPGTVVYAKSFLDDWQMFEVRSCSAPSFEYSIYDSKSPAKYTEKNFRITCAAFDWDGSKFNVFEYDFQVKRDPKKSELTINALEVFPTEYYRDDTGDRDDQKLRDELLVRGKKFWRLCNIESDDAQCSYQGAVLTSSTSRSIISHLIGDRQGDDEDDISSATDPDGSGSSTFNKKEYSGQLVVDASSFLRSQPQVLDAAPPLGPLKTNGWTGGYLECRW